MSNINFSRKFTIESLNLNKKNTINHNLSLYSKNNQLKNKYFISTNVSSYLKNLKNNNNILLNNKGLNVQEEKYLNNINNNFNNKFSAYNKRFISSVHEIYKLNDINNKYLESLVVSNGGNRIKQLKTYSTISKTLNDSEKKGNKKEPNFSNKRTTDNENEEKVKDLGTVLKKYGFIAVTVYFVLSCIIYFTTLGIILYYDIDPDELTKKSKTFVTNLTKKIMGRVDNLEIKLIEEAHKNNKEQDNKEIEEVQTINKKRKLLKTMIMTFAVTQVFSPPKTMLTLIITPYLAKLFKKGI